MFDGARQNQQDRNSDKAVARGNNSRLVFQVIARSALQLAGTQTCAVADLESGACLGMCSTEIITDVARVCTLNAQVIRTKLRLIRELHTGEAMEDIMITLEHHYHLIRIVDGKGATPALFLYLVVNRSTTNLVLARRKLADIEQALWRIPDIEQLIYQASNSAMTYKHVNNRPLEVEADELDELPPFMRDEVVRKLLGIPVEDINNEVEHGYLK